MGTCFSSSKLPPPSTAKVVSINGTLHEYIVPVFVSQVVEAEVASSSSYFLCNSDLLSYDDYIPALDSSAQLYADQLYFVLPRSKLQNRVSASDMAALAVKASVALQNASKKEGHRPKKARISPVLLSPPPFTDDIKSFEKPIGKRTQQQQQPGAGISRSESFRKLHKYTSRRAKLAVRSFRLRLTTIYEGTVL